MNKLFFAIIFSCFIIRADAQTVDFSFASNNGSFCNPATVVFTQTCTGNPVSFIWNFGNGKYSSKPIDSVKYNVAGSYTVQLIAVFANTTLKISKTIVINPAVTAAIAVDKNYICQPGTINFTGSGSNVTGYKWNFGDGSAPVKTNTADISHTYAFTANFTVQLTTTSNSGCSDTASTQILVKKPDIQVTVSKIRGCVPAQIDFGATATLPANGSIASYTWDFGDGSVPTTTNKKNISYTYTVIGNYFPKVTITTNEGCTNTYNFVNFLYFGTPPTNQVAFAPTNPVCGSDSAVFVSRATNANRYFWEFGDGTNASTSDTIIKHKYNYVGNVTARVKALFNECDAVTKTFPFRVIGVIAKFGYANTCANKNTYSFFDTSSGKPTARRWDFGDGTQLADVPAPVHTFPTTGQFKVTLYLKDSVTGCSDTMSRMIYTAIPRLYTPDTIVCRKDSLHFFIADNYGDTSIRYSWTVPDSVTGPVSSNSITVAANRFGNFNGRVILTHPLTSCSDTLSLDKLILIRGPKVNFTTPAELCLNTALAVTNNSQPYQAADTIVSWAWNFGNSSSDDIIFQPQPFYYEADGNYSVRLVATDMNGCSDTLIKPLQVNPIPFLHVSLSTDSICIGQSDTLMAFHNNDLRWSPAGNISCATCDTAVVTPTVSGTYYGTATNSFNCSVRDSVHIGVAARFTAAISPAEVSICQKETTSLDVNPKGKIILWSPTAGLSSPFVYNPVITGNNDIIYTATLTDSSGCLFSSSATLKVHVKPLPSVDAGPDKFYSKGTSFSITPQYSDNVRNYLWLPTSALSCNNCASPAGIANSNQQYVIKVTSDSGCVASDSLQIGVDCTSSYIFMPKAFTPNNDNLNDIYYPTTSGIRSITKFIIYNRQGRVMYQATNFLPNDRDHGWDGRYKGVLQSPGAYVYMIETICIIGDRIDKRGSFILIR